MKLLDSRNRIYIVVISTIFIFLFIWCPSAYGLSKTGLLKVTDIKNYKDPEKVYENVPLAGVLNGIEKGKAALDSLYTNYLPMYGDIVTVFKSSSSDMQMSFVDMLSKNSRNPISSAAALQVGSTEDTAGTAEDSTEPTTGNLQFSAMMVKDDGFHRYYAIRPYDFMDAALSPSEDILRADMEKQITEVNRIAAATALSNANFYLYVGTRMQDTDYFTQIIPNEISTKPYLDEFMSRIEHTTGKAAFDISTLDKRLERVFKTDIHWSAMGAYSGYCDIINMMSKVTPEIGQPIPLNGLITYPDVQMRGSADRISSFSRFYETFSVMDITLPTQDPKAKVTDQAEAYSEGKFDKSLYADHYANYYSHPYHYIYPGNHTGRKLLIIGDSYTWGSAWLIAANFDETFLFYPWDDKILNYNDYIEQNGITDVLFMQFSDRIMFNLYNNDSLNNIITR